MINLVRFNKNEFDKMIEQAHLVVFDENRSAGINRYDFALLAVNEKGVPVAYGLCREFDGETLYLGYGGVFPEFRHTKVAVQWYEEAIKMAMASYKRVTTYIENTNIAMLKLAMHCGLRIIGIKLFNNQVFCELIKEG